jgi:hypothetical protein
MPKDQALFRVEFFVTTDKLGKVLWLLAGDALNLTQHPVINARQKGGELVPRVRNGNLVELFREHLAKTKLREVDANTARAFCKQHGRSEGSYSVLLKQAADLGFLKNVGIGFHSKWKVMKRAAPKRKVVKRKAARRKPVLKVVGGANG